MSKVFENEIRVRYGETDQMGIVYYGNYALYLELARTELLRSLGLSYKELEETGIQLPVVNLNVNYRKSATYDDLLRIETKIIGNINKKICFSSEIYNQLGDLVAKGDVELVFVDVDKKKVVRCPEAMIDKLSRYQWA